MKKNMILKVAAVLTMLTLALVITVVPGTALAAISGVSISPSGGASYTIPVGGTVTLNAVLADTAVGAVTYNWDVTSGSTNITLVPTAGTAVVTGVTPSTTATVQVTAIEAGGGTFTSSAITITMMPPMTISETAITLDGGSSKTLTVGNVPSTIATTWLSSRDLVASVSSSGQVTAVGAGTATITATNGSQSKTCTVTVNPIVTITPASQNITAANTAGTIQLTVQYGGDLIGPASTVSWGNSNPTAGSLTVAPTTFTPSGTSLVATATFLSNSTGVNASSTVTATIAGAGSYTVPKTSTVDVRTARYLTLEGNATLNKDNRYGDYTLTLHEANGTVVNDSASTVHWSWSSSYLSVSNAALNADRAKMINGVAKIQMYARYNTPSGGTRIYAWINNDSGNKVYTSVVISGLSSLPQTGQDMTLIYVFSGTAAALIAVAGVWYGIRKKHTVA